VVKKTTSYAVNASTGALTPTEKKEIFKQNGAKSTVVVTPLEPSVRYDKDATRARGGENVTVAGTPGTSTVTTTYTVNPTDGSLIPHEELAVVVPSKPTVVRLRRLQVTRSMQAPVPLLQQRKRKSSNKMALKLQLLLRHYSQVFVMIKMPQEPEVEKM